MKWSPFKKNQQGPKGGVPVVMGQMPPQSCSCCRGVDLLDREEWRSKAYHYVLPAVIAFFNGLPFWGYSISALLFWKIPKIVNFPGALTTTALLADESHKASFVFLDLWQKEEYLRFAVGAIGGMISGSPDVQVALNAKQHGFLADLLWPIIFFTLIGNMFINAGETDIFKETMARDFSRDKTRFEKGVVVACLAMSMVASLKFGVDAYYSLLFAGVDSFFYSVNVLMAVYVAALVVLFNIALNYVKVKDVADILMKKPELNWRLPGKLLLATLCCLCGYSAARPYGEDLTGLEDAGCSHLFARMVGVIVEMVMFCQFAEPLYALIGHGVNYCFSRCATGVAARGAGQKAISSPTALVSHSQFRPQNQEHKHEVAPRGYLVLGNGGRETGV